MIEPDAGSSEETLPSLVISHAGVVMRSDRQHHEGLGIIVRVAHGLKVPRMRLVVDKTLPILDPGTVKANAEPRYGRAVAMLVPPPAR